MDLQRVIANPVEAQALYLKTDAEILRRSFKKFAYDAFPEVEGTELSGNWHIDQLCDVLQAWAVGDIPWLMVNMPPRHLKSVLISILLPAWMWIREPGCNFIYASYALNLSLRDARKTKLLIQSRWFMERFADSVMIAKGASSNSDYSTNKRGRRISVTAQSKTTGEGGHANIVDDLHNVKDVESDKVRRSTIEWHDDAFWNRYIDPMTHRRLYVGQRTHMSDVYGHVMAKHGDKFVQVELPMEYIPSKKLVLKIKRDDKVVTLFDDPRKEEGDLIHPARMDADTLASDKISLSDPQYQAQYQQSPQGDGGLIIKKKYWFPWEWPEGHKDAGKQRAMPTVVEIFQCYDTAFEETEQADFSARTTWGLFQHPDPGMNSKWCIILLDRLNDRLGFSDLVKEAIRSRKEMDADRILVEKKASGHSLKQVLRKKKQPVLGVKIDGGRKALDKVARAHYVSVAFEAGMVYYVPGRIWSHEVIDQVCGFPQLDHDDMADTVFMAVAYALNRNKLQINDNGDVSVFVKKEVTPGYGNK